LALIKIDNKNCERGGDKSPSCLSSSAEKIETDISQTEATERLGMNSQLVKTLVRGKPVENIAQTAAISTQNLAHEQKEKCNEAREFK